jgi:hypothetical protein
VTAVFTATPTIAWSDKFEIKNLLAFPNPVYPGEDLKVNIGITRPAGELTLRIYTRSFRRVMEISCGASYVKNTILSIPAEKIKYLSSGIYYLSITGRSTAGADAVSKPVEIIILK